MNKPFLSLLLAAAALAACNPEMNRVYKSPDFRYKYEYAKESFAQGKYVRATNFLSDIITLEKGTENAQESLYMLGMAQFNSKDYDGAAATFKKYYQSYPKGHFAEMAEFYIGQSLYLSTPEVRLDQSGTVAAIAAFQEYLDLFHDAKYKDVAQQRLFELQDKLVKKELLSAQLYYDLGTYFGNCTSGGNNYEACIVTAQNALKEYPYTAMREDFSLLIMKSKYELAQQSVEEKMLERYQDAEDECYGFINQYPESKDKALAEKFIAKCKRVTKGHTD